MRYKLVLKICAESQTTGESVELCPDGLIEDHPSMESLLTSLQLACEQGWGAVSTEQLSDFYTRLVHEADAVARILDKRGQEVAAVPAGEESKGRRKEKSRSKADAIGRWYCAGSVTAVPP